MLEERPGPVHIEIPTNVLNYEYQKLKKIIYVLRRKKLNHLKRK